MKLGFRNPGEVARWQVSRIQQRYGRPGQLHGRFPELKERMGEMGMLDVDAIADAFWTLHTQHPSAWTWELDVRPFKEKW